jgi:hypothetical protein
MINVVVSRYRRDTSFVYKLKGVHRFFIYDKETTENPNNIPVNKGQEASVYLKYVIDRYEKLPEFTFFIHDEEYAWHHSGSIVDKFDEAVASGKKYFNINDKAVMGSIFTNKWYNEIVEWYSKYIEPYIPMNSLPNKDWTDGHLGSAQFLVHRSNIQKLPKKFYEDLYTWITTTDMENQMSARFLEWTWHLFWDDEIEMLQNGSEISKVEVETST